MGAMRTETDSEAEEFSGLKPRFGHFLSAISCCYLQLITILKSVLTCKWSPVDIIRQGWTYVCKGEHISLYWLLIRLNC